MEGYEKYKDSGVKWIGAVVIIPRLEEPIWHLKLGWNEVQAHGLYRTRSRHV